jgi:hypothetical protein
VSIFKGDVVGYGPPSETSLVTGTIPVRKGDVIDFTVGYGNNGTFFNDTTSIAATITAVTPEPSTFTLLGLSALGLLGYGWRRKKRALA